MAIPTGTMLGPYRAEAKLGEGGMGEVYRARDTRLGRDVAIKVLPAAVAGDPDRLRRFEAEARTAGSLNHPNLVTLFDVGAHQGSPYLVMELLDGESLRDKLAGKPLPAKRAVEIARGIAEGLSAAHDRGIIHRDLKPENLFVTRDGRVKILDFGLAKLLHASEPSEPVSDDQPTDIVGPRAVATEAGVILGSVGYMSPEQVRGQELDARSDLFALGVILWEMLTGSRPFRGPSAIEAMHAIANDDPPDLDPGLRVPPVLERIVRTCLAKEPAGRFHSAHDLAFALETLSSSSNPTVAIARRPRSALRRWAVLGGALLSGVAIGAGVIRWAGRAPLPSPPSFHKLTFGRGTIDGARFVPGSRDIAYSARWQGGPSTIYLLREGSVEPRALDAPGAMLLATSAQGAAAVMTGPVLYNGVLEGTISDLPLAGGGTREVSRTALAADFSADGSELCLVTRTSSNQFQLEWPQGETLLEPATRMLRAPRIRGSRLAFFEAPLATIANGGILVVAKGEQPRSLVHCAGFTSLAWGPDGREVWFSTFDGGESQIQAVTLEGHVRLLARQAGRLELMDVDSSGRALAIVSSESRQAFGRAPGGNQDADLTWLDAQAPLSLRRDGSQVVLARASSWDVPDQVSLYIRPLNRGPATKVGTGTLWADISPDGLWVATMAPGPGGQPGVRLIPTGAGAARWYAVTGPAVNSDAGWFHPDGRSIYLPEEVTNTVSRLDVATGSITPNVVPGPVGYTLGLAPFSPDGRRLLLLDNSNAIAPKRSFAFKVFEGDDPKPTLAKGNLRSEVVAGWSDNNREAYLYDRNAIPATIVRWNPLTGARRPFLQITPSDPSGVWGISHLAITPSGNAYVYSVLRKLSDLYLIEGLK